MSNDSSSTPGRKTVIVLDGEETIKQRKFYATTRSLSEIGGSGSKTKNVQFIRLIGWQLEALQSSAQSELTAVNDDAMIPDRDLRVADGVEMVKTHLAPIDLPNATSGADSGLLTSGYPWLQYQIKAGANWDVGLAYNPFDPPESARPTYGSSKVVYAMKTMLATIEHHDPRQPFFFSFKAPPGISATSLPIRIFFNGPCSADMVVSAEFGSEFVGYGLFCISFFGDGSYVWHEYGFSPLLSQTYWRERPQRGRWTDSAAHEGEWHHFKIVPLGELFDKKDAGGLVALLRMPILNAQEHSSGTPPYSALGKLADQSTTSTIGITARPGEGGPIARCPIWVETANPIRPGVQLSWPTYKTPGEIDDGPFTIPNGSSGTGSDQVPLVVNWDADTPDGTTVACAVLRADDGTTLDDFSATDDFPDRPNQKQFVIPDGEPRNTSYYVKWTLTTSNTRVTPTLKRYDVARQGTHLVTEGNPITIPDVGGNLQRQFMTSLSITGAGNDITHESASIGIFDANGALSILRNRGDVPIVVKVQLPGDQESVIFRGIVPVPEWNPYGATPGNYPTSQGGRFNLTCAGMHLVFKQMLSPVRWNLFSDADGKPWQIANVVSALPSWHGYANRVDVPGIDKLDFPLIVPVGGVGSPDILIEPGDDPEKFLISMVNGNLDWSFYFDPNASPTASPSDFLGMYRLLPLATRGSSGYYAPKYAFIHSGNHPCKAGSGPVLAGHFDAYSNVTSGDGSSVPVTYIKKENGRSTFDSKLWPPEFNELTVSGLGYVDGGIANLVQTWFNQKSFDFTEDGNPPDPASSVYLRRVKPEYYFDPTLDSAERLNFVAARLALRAGSAIRVAAFVAPLVFITDSSDRFQCRPRMLRYQDPILLLVGTRQVEMLIEAVHPIFEKDSAQWAVYEAVIPPDIAGLIDWEVA